MQHGTKAINTHVKLKTVQDHEQRIIDKCAGSKIKYIHQGCKKINEDFLYVINNSHPQKAVGEKAEETENFRASNPMEGKKKNNQLNRNCIGIKCCITMTLNKMIEV